MRNPYERTTMKVFKNFLLVIAYGYAIILMMLLGLVVMTRLVL